MNLQNTQKLVPLAHSGPHVLFANADRYVAISRLLEAFLSGKNKNTLDAYRMDLEDFRQFLSSPTAQDAIGALIQGGHGEANYAALEYRNHLLSRGLQPATINRRLAALRSVTKLARTLGLVSWCLEIPNVKSKPYRDTRGPGRSAIERALDHLDRDQKPKTIRDRAIIYLFATLALRRIEIVGVHLADVDLAAKTISIRGKGQTEKEKMSLPDVTQQALSEWIGVRGDQPGPLFVSYDRAKKGSGGLTPSGLYKMVRLLGEKLELRIRPHGMRHTAVTEGIKAAKDSDITLREVMQFSRHASLATLQIYADYERNVQGRLAQLIAERLRKRGA